MVFRRPFSEPGAVQLYSFVFNQPKLRASTALFDRLSVLRAVCTALDCPPAKYRGIRRAAVQARANLNRHRGHLASASVDWHYSDGWGCDRRVVSDRFTRRPHTWGR